jgi:hypothetical protein
VRLTLASAAAATPANVHKTGARTVEKLIISVHESGQLVDSPVDNKIAQFSFLDWVAGGLRRL